MDLVSGTQCPAWIDQLEKWSEQGSGPKGLKNVVTALMTVFQTKNRIVNFFFLSLFSCCVHKVRYTATNVACGWAGAVMKKANSSILAGAVMQKTPRNAENTIKQTATDGPSDRHSGL